MKIIRGINDLTGKKVLLRTDFDLPILENGMIAEIFRIKKQKETIDYLANKDAKIVLVAHISPPAGGSFSAILPQLEQILNRKIEFIRDIPDIQKFLNSSGASIGLLDNIRNFKGEKENDESFASELAKGFDIYVNNAFAVCHRNQASVSAITSFLPSYAGFLIEEEIRNLQKAMSAPIEDKVIIIGGAKASTKAPVIKNFLDKAEMILLGGVVANDVIKQKGYDVGDSLVDENVAEVLAGIDLNNPKIVIPEDFNLSGERILDIGPKTAERYSRIISNAKTVIWNGPMGMFEKEEFSKGTKAVAEAVIGVRNSIIGGGDTISAIGKLGLIDPDSISFQDNYGASKFTFISTGGGAMLEFLAGNVLPGIRALQK